MLKTLSIALFATLVGTGIANAGWERQVTTTGPNGGTWSHHGSGSCSGGTCSSTQTRTGPRGNSVTREGTTNCWRGGCNGTATYTGPRGNTWTRTRSFRRR